MKRFESYNEYEIWTEQFEDCSEYEEVPCVIDDGWKISMDMFTDCKSWKTALRRFDKLFGDYDENVKGWIDGIKESCENGCFGDRLSKDSYYGMTDQEIKNILAAGVYSWGVEENSEGHWYIFLNISGIYAER